MSTEKENRQDLLQERALFVARRLLVGPEPQEFHTFLQQAGIEEVESDVPSEHLHISTLGVLTIPLLIQEIQEDPQVSTFHPSRKEARALATGITDKLLHGQTNTVTQALATVRYERGIFYREGLKTAKIAEERLTHYMKAKELQEEDRRESARKEAEREASLAEEQARKTPVEIRLYSARTDRSNRDQVIEGIRAAEQALPEGEAAEYNLLSQEDTQYDELEILQGEYRAIIDDIVGRGISKIRIPSVIARTRQIMQSIANKRLEEVEGISRQIVNAAKSTAQDHTKERHVLFVAVDERMDNLIARDIEILREGASYITKGQETFASSEYSPYTERMITTWSFRYHPKLWNDLRENLEELKAKGDPIGTLGLELADNPQLLGRLQLGESSITLPSQSVVTRERLDTFLQQILLADHYITSALIEDTFKASLFYQTPERLTEVLDGNGVQMRVNIGLWVDSLRFAEHVRFLTSPRENSEFWNDIQAKLQYTKQREDEARIAYHREKSQEEKRQQVKPQRRTSHSVSQSVASLKTQWDQIKSDREFIDRTIGNPKDLFKTQVIFYLKLISERLNRDNGHTPEIDPVQAEALLKAVSDQLGRRTSDFSRGY